MKLDKSWIVIIALILVGCATPTSQLIRETVSVETEAEKVVKETVIVTQPPLPTATQVPTATSTQEPTETPSPTFTATITPTPTPILPDGRVKISRPVRAGPGTSYREIGRVEKDAIVIVLGVSTNEWYKIKASPTLQGWVPITAIKLAQEGREIESIPEKDLPPTPRPTSTPRPTDTPRPTVTPTNTPAPTSTPIPETPYSPKWNGLYTVGAEIAPGKWHSTGSGNACYWARLDANQKILGNHFGLAGGTITILASDYEVHLEDCGLWEYVEGAERQLLADASSPKGDGFYTVGVEIVPGKWHSAGSGSACYWARLDANQGILDNHFGLAGGTITILASDYEVHLEDCGLWEYVGP